MTSWFGILKDLAYMNEGDDICCAEARKKFMDLFIGSSSSDDSVSFTLTSGGPGKTNIDRTEGKKDNMDIASLLKFYSCLELRKLPVVRIDMGPEWPLNMSMYELTINTKIGTVSIMIGSEKADRIEEIKEQWKECENRLM